MTYAMAVLLGLVQGVTEFLPISSSGHLALAGHLFGDAPQSLFFDILLHLATVVVVIGYFYKDFLHFWSRRPVVIVYLAIGIVPAGLVGLLFHDPIGALRESPVAVCCSLLVTAGALVAAERILVSPVPLPRMGVRRSLIIGMTQALAIVPGISRSGSTIAGGVLCGLSREDAIRFSFLLMVPAVLGAPLVELAREPEALASVAIGPGIVGFLVALVSGFAALRLLIIVTKQHKLLYFAAYCALVGVAGLVYFGILGG